MPWLSLFSRPQAEAGKRNMDKNGIFVKVQDILVETFEMNAADITMDARLFDDLDLDSIDAVDLVVKLQEYTGRKIDPAVFKTVRTVSDVVDAIADILEGVPVTE